jgi:hypothetical protein
MDAHKDWKAAEASREAVSDNLENETLPPYQENTPTPSTLLEGASMPSTLSEGSSAALGPTISSPFNFPSTDLPPYSPTAYHQRPIAVPQRWPDPAASFLTAYSTSLLNYGITAQTFHSFLDTLSAFLTAKVSKRAISHAGDIATSLGRVPQGVGKDFVAHAKETGRNIATSAKRGSPVGVVGGVIGGAVGLTVGTAFKAVGSLFQLPGTAIVAAANPKTPRGRVEAYVAAANRDWFRSRGLYARLLDTVELTGLLGVDAGEFLDVAGTESASADGKLRALRRWIDDLEVRDNGSSLAEASTSGTPHPSATASTLAGSNDSKSAVYETAENYNSALGKRPISAQDAASPPCTLRLGSQTLWLVLFPIENQETEAEKGKSGKQKK